MSARCRNTALVEGETELLVRKKPTGSRGVPEEEAASFDEIGAAVDALRTEDWLRLRAFARFRMAGLSREQLKARTHEDLLSEAIARTATGDRRWRRSVPFAQFLLGAMRSISTAWRHEANPDLAVSASQLPPGDDGEATMDPVEAAEGTEPDPLRFTLARETVAEIKRHFADDECVPVLLDGLEQGLAVAETAAALGVEQKTVEAALKKLRRHVRSHFPDWRTR